MFDFHLPPHLIAQYPSERRDQSRLLVVRRASATLAHHRFADLPELLQPGDLLILNDTRVMPARLLGQREKTGGKWEGLFLREGEDGSWELLCQTRGTLGPGEWIAVEPGPTWDKFSTCQSDDDKLKTCPTLRLQLLHKNDSGSWQARPSETGAATEILPRYGHIPLPPYIRKGRAGEEDRERYQTVYAQRPGAVAAPTAGLHFTPEIFDQLRQRGIDWSHVTLHVGWGTFQPLADEDHTKHKIHSEWGELSEATAQAIERCRQRGGRVVAVGTTSVRVLETSSATGPLRPWSGETDLYIYPPYQYKVVDVLVTNFHLPRTTLLLLVSAFAGEDLLRKVYETAIAEEYRFYSYGDAMLIL